MHDFLEDLEDFFDEKIVVPMLEFSRKHPKFNLRFQITALVIQIILLIAQITVVMCKC